MTRYGVALVALSGLKWQYSSAQSTLSTILANRNDIDSFNELLNAAGFSSGILRSVGFDGTVLAPNDSAFEAVPLGLYTSLLDSEWSDHVTCFVSYHIVEGSFMASQLTDGAELTTLDGNILTVSGANPIQISQASIVEDDIVASNGVAHILNAVLMPACASENIYQQLSANEDYSTMAGLIETAGLVDMISTTAPITVFAPTNQAWLDMGDRFIASLSEPENLTFLQALLMNHIVPGNWYESRLLSDESFTLQTTLDTTVFFYNESTTNFVTNSEVIETDTLASNGVIHTVDPVIILAAVADLLLNAQVVSNFISFSNFTAALMQANFFDALFLDDLNTPRTTTVFAPDDEAFARVPANITAKLLDPNWSFHLRELLRYHLSDGTVKSSELSQLSTVSTLATNFSLTIISERNMLMVNNATVTFPDIVAYNGVIHGINEVMFPPSLTTSILEQLQANSQFSTFLGFVQASNNITTLLQSDGPMTIFVPTNSAFELFDMTVGSSQFSPTEIQMILDYHVSEANVFLNELSNETAISTLNGQDLTFTTSTDDGGDDLQFLDEARVLDGGVASNGVLYVLNEVMLPNLPTTSPTASPAPTFNGFIAPSSAPSEQPVMGTWPAMPTSSTETSTSGAMRLCSRVACIAGLLLSCFVH